MESGKHFTKKNTEPEDDLSRREKDFLTYFGYLNDRLINHFSCACQSATDIILYHGRMFITERYICFSSHIIKEYLKVIPFSEVTNIVKKNTALVFSNAIGVTHKKGSEFFTSFLHRDKVFDLINTLWRKNKGEESLGINLRSLIKQEQEAVKPQPDSSMPDARKPSIVGINPIESPPVSPREVSPDLFRPKSPPPSEGTSSHSENSENSPSSPEKKRGNVKRTNSQPQELLHKKKSKTAEHPLDLSLLRSAKPKKRIVKQDDSIPEEILQEIENEKKKLQPPKISNGTGEEQEDDKAVDIFQDVLFPENGNFVDHVTIDSEPCVDRVFANITPKEFYAKVLYSATFWEHVFVVTDSTDIDVPDFQKPNENAVYLERICKFVAPIKGAPMGPKQTRVHQTHRVSIPSEDHIIFDSSNVSLDIPMYSDAFVVESLWHVRKEGSGIRLQIRWKVRYLKSVWVKGMIEKNAKVATEEFYRVWADEAQKELTKKKEAVESGSITERKNVQVDDDVLIKHPVLFDKEEQLDTAGNEITIPLVGIQVSLSAIATFAFIMLILCSGTYFYLRIHYLNADIANYKHTHHELEDRLVFLQSIAARLAMNFTEGSLHKEWGSWRKNKLDLDWRLSEWQDEIHHLQETLSETLVNVGNVLEYSSSKGLGESENTFLLPSEVSTAFITGNKKIVEKTKTSYVGYNYWVIGLVTFSVVSISTTAFFLTQK